MTISRLYAVFRQCLHQRKHPDEFDELIACAIKRWSASKIEIVACLVQSALDFCLPNDPLIPLYLQTILHSRHAQPSNFLTFCMQRWQRDHVKAASLPSARTFAQLMTDFTLIFSNMQATAHEARICMMLSARWMHALMKLADDHEAKHDPEQNSILAAAVSLFLITAMNTHGGTQSIKNVENSKSDSLNVILRQVIQGSMAVLPDISVQLMAEAEKHPALLDSADPASGNNQESEMVAFQFEAGIAQVPVLPSRAATYCYIYTKLLNGSQIDDGGLCNFLTTRHSGDNMAMFADVLFSSFEALTKPPQSQQPLYKAQCYIYLHNKLPSILAIINAFGQVPTQACLQELWDELVAIGNADALDAAKHFLHVCALHHLITADAVQSMTGKDSASTKATGLLSKQRLVNQVNENPVRGPRLVDELMKNDGNAAAISHAIMDIIHRHCQAKETQHLKEMANALVRQPSTISTIGMCVRPSYFLMPLCRLVDDWSWDIHGESQPIYEEFGSILLLIMTFKHRLRLKDSQMGITVFDGFMAQYLSSVYGEKFAEQMTQQENDNLGQWIENLYFSEGISDDVTTNCSAKEFYVMIPTLLRQSLMAFSKGALPQDKLDGGLDYLVEPFLLPSLLPAFAWLAQAAEKDVKNVAVLVRRLIKSPENQETAKVHRTILDIGQDFFQRALWRVRSQPEYSELISMFGEGPNFAVNPGVTPDELSVWKSQDGGMLPYLQRCISDLVAIPSLGLFQPNILSETTNLLGPNAVVGSMVTLLVQFAQSHDFAHLLDVLATLVASASTTTFSLRHSLQLLHSQLGSYVKKGDALFAEALVHFHRQSELYTTALIPQPGADDSALMSMQDDDLAEINLDQIPMETEASKQTPVPIQQSDPLAADKLDQMFSGVGDMGDMNDFTGDNDQFFDIQDYELQDLGDLDMMF